MKKLDSLKHLMQHTNLPKTQHMDIQNEFETFENL